MDGAHDAQENIVIARIVALLLLIWALGFAIFAVALPAPADDRATDAIVVVTGGSGRVPRGLALLAAHRAKRMLVSGADRRVRPVELAAANHAPPGLVACCVDLGYEANDTRANADETVAWMKAHRYKSVRLVTSDWHMPRARFELERVLGRDIALVADAVPSTPGLSALFNEYNKYLWRRVVAPLGL
jgi:uncharacterized SAM-binding protein YcdF (DUF218 family)